MISRSIKKIRKYLVVKNSKIHHRIWRFKLVILWVVTIHLKGKVTTACLEKIRRHLKSEGLLLKEKLKKILANNKWAIVFLKVKILISYHKLNIVIIWIRLSYLKRLEINMKRFNKKIRNRTNLWDISSS